MEVLQTSPLATWVRRPCRSDFSGAETLTHASRHGKFAPRCIAHRRSPQCALTFAEPAGLVYQAKPVAFLPVLALAVRHALVVRSNRAWRVPHDLRVTRLSLPSRTASGLAQAFRNRHHAAVREAWLPPGGLLDGRDRGIEPGPDLHSAMGFAG